MVSDSKSHVIILRRVIGVKFNIGKKSNRVRNNDTESSAVFKLIELMFKESYTVFRDILESGQEGWTFIILYNTKDFYEWKIDGFLRMENQFNINLQMNYLQKDN